MADEAPRARALLALDLATRFGWAFLSTEGKVTFGSDALPSTGENVGKFLAHYDDWLADRITLFAPDVLVFETPWVNGDTAQATAVKLLCLGGLTELICYRRGVECWAERIPVVRKHFIGIGNAKRDEAKRLTVAACRAKGWMVRNDDEADALALLDCHASYLELPNFGRAA